MRRELRGTVSSHSISLRSMTSTAAAATAPTIENARRAAVALAKTGAGRVVLFGSVARGASTDRSDIDLIAIYDDIDYSRRREIADPAQSAAKDAAGFPVDVLVTDRPEWKMRTTQVLTSVEARAERLGTVLLDRPEGIVDWNKEMVMPADDYREALYRLRHVAVALEGVLERLKPSRMYARYTELGWIERADESETGRMLTLGGSCQIAAEASLKALIHLTAEPESEPWGHKIELLVRELPQPTQTYVTDHLLHPVRQKDLAIWHTWSRYHERGKDPDPIPEVVEPLIRSVCRLATYTAAQFTSEPSALNVSDCADQIAEFLDTHNLSTGHPHPGTGDQDSPGIEF